MAYHTTNTLYLQPRWKFLLAVGSVILAIWKFPVFQFWWSCFWSRNSSFSWQLTESLGMNFFSSLQAWNFVCLSCCCHKSLAFAIVAKILWFAPLSETRSFEERFLAISSNISGGRLSIFEQLSVEEDLFPLKLPKGYWEFMTFPRLKQMKLNIYFLPKM